MADNRCPNCGKGLAHVAFIESDRAIELPCSCEPAPDALTLILAEMKAIRAALTPVDLVTGFADVHRGEAVYPAAGETVDIVKAWAPVELRTPASVDELGFPTHSVTLTCKRKEDKFVVRIPDSPTRVLVAVEGPAGMWVSGWLIENGSTAGSPRALLNRLSASGASPAPRSSGLGQSQAFAPSPETPTSARPCHTGLCPQSLDAQDPASPAS